MAITTLITPSMDRKDSQFPNSGAQAVAFAFGQLDDRRPGTAGYIQ